MTKVTCFLVLLFFAQDEGVLRPQSPQVTKRGDKWEVKFPLQTDNLPDRTIVQIRIVPSVLRYIEPRKTLQWQVSEVNKPPRRVKMRKGRAELRTMMATLRRITVSYFVDANAQTHGAKITKTVKPVRVTHTLGTLQVRVKGLRENYSIPGSLNAKLLSLLDKLERAAKSGNPSKGANSLVLSFGQLKVKIIRAYNGSPYTASLGLLKAVHEDAATYASWLANKEIIKSRKGASGDATADNAGAGETPGGVDNPGGEGEGENTDPPPATSSGINRGAGNIDNESVARLRKRLANFKKIHTAETFIQFVMEVQELVKKAAAGETVDKKALKSFERAFDYIVKKHYPREFAKTGVVIEIRGAISAIRTLESGDEEQKLAAKELLTELKVNLKKRVAILSGLRKEE